MIDKITGARKPVKGLWPELISAPLMGGPLHLQCGGCGFSGIVQNYVILYGKVEPVCDCPLPATLRA